MNRTLKPTVNNLNFYELNHSSGPFRGLFMLFSYFAQTYKLFNSVFFLLFTNLDIVLFRISVFRSYT